MKYNPALDGIRAIAVLAVVAFHAKVAIPGGWLGVDVFFVLSGYLITAVLAADPGYKLATFYGRRMKRLYPALAAFLLAYVVLAPLMWPEYPFAKVLKGALLGGLYLNSYTYNDYGGPNYVAQLWSLAVEVHFYLAWGAALPFVLSLNFKKTALFVMALAATYLRFREVDLTGFDDAYHFSHTRLSGLLFGAWLALIVADLRITKLVANIIGLISVPGLFYVLDNAEWKSIESLKFGVMLVEAFTLGTIVWAQTRPFLLRNPIMQWIGIYSYGIYLWHYPLIRWLRPGIPAAELFVIATSFALIMSALSYHTIEKSFRIRRAQRQPDLRLSGEGPDGE